MTGIRPLAGKAPPLWRVPVLRLLILLLACPLAPFREARAAEAGTPAILQLAVNGMDKGAVRVLLQPPEIMILVAALRDAGLVIIPGNPEKIGEDLYVRASALAPKISARYDEDNLTLSLSVDPLLLTPTSVDLAVPPEKVEYIRNNTGFINYAFTSQDLKNLNLLTEQGVSIGGSFVDNAFSVTDTGRFNRLNTSITIDNRDRLTRLVLGDTVAEAGILGGASRLAGISYGRAFAINPYFTPFPGQRFAGVITTPSTADVYVNGLLVRTVELPPGPFNLQNLPALSGAGATRVVIRNAFGLTQELGAPYYLDTHVLRRGLSDFNYTIGVERAPGSSSLGNYSVPAFVGHHRYGITDTLTAGGFLTADTRKVAGGPEVTLSLPIGLLALYGAGSQQQGIAGGSASVQYVYQSPRFSIGAAFTATSPHYATVGLDQADDRATRQISAFVGSRFFRDVDFSLNVYDQHYRDSGDNQQINLTTSIRLADRYNLALSLFHTETEHLRPNNGVYAALTMALGRETTATVSANHDAMSNMATLQVQKSRPLGEGWAYLAQASFGRNAVDIADVQYQGAHGFYEVDATHVGGQTTTTLSAAGAITFIGGNTFFTRPVQDAYGVIQVPGVAGVTGYVSHQDVGKTDSQGNLLVPNLLSYYGNQIGIEPQDIAIDYSVAETDRTIAPSYRGGAVIAFPVKKLQAFQGTLELRRGAEVVVPVYGDLAVVTKEETLHSPIGANGEFYLENLPLEQLPATIEFEGKSCAFVVSVPRSGDRFVQLGRLACVESP